MLYSFVTWLKSTKLVCKLKETYLCVYLYQVLQKIEIRLFDAFNVKNEKRQRENYRKYNGGKIKTAFLTTYLPAWNKFKPLYFRMLSDDRFSPQIICLPKIEYNKVTEEDGKNSTFDYLKKNGYDVINALNPDGSWYDLKAAGFDYVFYTKPFNEEVPPEYTTDVVGEYTRVCNICYGMAHVKEMYNISINWSFFKSAYLYFPETRSSEINFRNQFVFSVKKGLKKCRYLGTLPLEQMMADRDIKTDIWDFAGERFRLLWTPRWSTNRAIGGSNFFVYYKEILEFAKSNPDIAILIRPHPELFNNFLKTGELPGNEQAMWRAEIDKLCNVALDENNEYDGTFWGSDALLGDFSAILPEYFVTGKPLIFCSSNMILTPLEHFKQMLKGCYIAPDKETAFGYISALKEGRDEKAELRKKLANDIFGINEESVSKRMVDYLYNCLTDPGYDE